MSLSFKNEGQIAPTQEILNQPFHYLARGGQMFVFASQDGKYVIKFFKNTPNSLVPLRKYHSKKRSKLIRDIEGYLLAFKRVPKESGLVFLKLDQETPFNQTIEITDKLGIAHKLSLQKTLFVIQKKGEDLTSYLKHTENVQAVFDSIAALMKLRRENGIEDTDSHLSQNLGFIEGMPSFLDPGKFVESYTQTTEYPEKFITWVKTNYPEAIL